MLDNMGGWAMKIIVYHGGTEIVENPMCAFGRKNLDFGQGFYVTDIKEQAVKFIRTYAEVCTYVCISPHVRMCKLVRTYV